MLHKFLALFRLAKAELLGERLERVPKRHVCVAGDRMDQDSKKCREYTHEGSWASSCPKEPSIHSVAHSVAPIMSPMGSGTANAEGNDKEFTRAEAKAALDALRANQDRWLEVPASKKIEYLDLIVRRLGNLDLGAWAAENARVWGFDPDDTSLPQGQNALGMESLVPPIVIKVGCL